MKIIVIGALPSSLINFRGDLIKSFVEKGYSVTAMASNADRNTINEIKALGVEYIDYPVARNGLSIKEDIRTFWFLFKTFKKEKPDVVLAYTIKPVIWGGLAARLNKTSFYALITGLGFAFQGESFKRRVLSFFVKKLYGSTLKKSSAVIFQNLDNRDVFVENNIVPVDKCYRVHGSGVNLNHFELTPLPLSGAVFTTIARLLGEKGLREYAEAAAIVKKQYPDTVIRIVGPADPSPDGIPLDEINQWQQSGAIDYMGEVDDVRPSIIDAHIYVLASYHEGMPRTVLEAMAIGRPILTTDVAGCRETVIEGENGWLVPKQDANSLAQKMIWFIEHKEQWETMAKASREIAEQRYDVHTVNQDILTVMKLK